MTGADWRLKEQREKEEKALEKKQEEFRLQQLRDKNDQRMAAEMATNEFLSQIRTCVDEICALEENIAVRKKDVEINSKLASKEMSLEEDIERIKTYYQGQKEDAERAFKTRMNALEREEKTALAKRENQRNELERKKEHQPISPAVKKMMIELQAKKEMYPRLLKGWSIRETKFPEYHKFPPEDYTQHETYKQRKAVAERAIPAEIQKSENKKVKSETKTAEPKNIFTFGGGSPPPPKTENIFEPRPPHPETPSQLSKSQIPVEPPVETPVNTYETPKPTVKPPITLYQGDKIIRKRKVAGSQATLNLFPTTHRQQKVELSHAEWYELRKKQIEEFEERKEREEEALRARLSKEEDEIEAEEIRLRRQEEQAEREWAAYQEDFS